MIAVLFNQADVRLGEVLMPDACRVIMFGGGLFVRTETEALLDEGGRGIAFECHDRYVIESLDRYNPRSTIGGKIAREARGETVQGRTPPAPEVEGRDRRK